MIQTQASFSYAIVVMDRIGGWMRRGRIEDGSQIVARLAASIWIYAKAVICNGHMDGIRNQKRYSIMEAINWVCTRVREDPKWTPEFSWIVQEIKNLEALIYDIDVPCSVQWEML